MRRPTRRQRACLEVLALGPTMPKDAPRGTMRELDSCWKRGWCRAEIPKLPPCHYIDRNWVTFELTDEGRHAIADSMRM